MRNVWLSVSEFKLKRSWFLQQDNAPKHTSKSTAEWLMINKMRTLEWPSHSPDLNPIKMQLHDLIKAVYSFNTGYNLSKMGELQQFCKDV